jgi:probable rRNA maturation factor
LTHFDLILAGEAPENADLSRLRDMVEVLTATAPDWLHDGIINLKLVDDAEIQELNKSYSGNDYATDVLSFSYIEDGAAPVDGELGDIAISLEMATRQAAAAGSSVADELATLALHGIMHINGFDHQTDEEKTTMNSVQREILTTAGVQYKDFKWE